MITLEQKQAAEDALHWALKFIGEGTYWHERHYPALRAALDAVEFDPTPASYVLSGLDAPEGTPGNELVSTDAPPVSAPAEAPPPAEEVPIEGPTGEPSTEEPPAPSGKKGKK